MTKQTFQLETAIRNSFQQAQAILEAWVNETQFKDNFN